MAFQTLSILILTATAAAQNTPVDVVPGGQPSAGTSRNAGIDPREVDQAIDSLKRISTDLNSASNQLETREDEAIAQFDSGYRTGEMRIPGADAEVGIGQPNRLRRAAARKSLIARMLASRTADYTPAALADLDRVQDLIVETRRRIDAADEASRRTLMVPVQKLGPKEANEWKTRHGRLEKARTAAEEAETRAILELPLDLPEADSPEESRDRAVDLIVNGSPVRKPEEAGHPGRRTAEQSQAIPIRWERHKRITLANEHGYRLALTDPGVNDNKGRHLFYEEEWVQRGIAVVRTRWRVAVDTSTGQHMLVKRYPPRQRRGDIARDYALWDRDYLWSLEPPEGSTEPSLSQVESALNDLAREREEIGSAVQAYRAAVGRALERNDRLQAAENQNVTDSSLSPELRAKLFAIRAHLGQSPEILEAEGKVFAPLDSLARRMHAVESLAAWPNRLTLDAPEATILPAAQWEILQTRSEDELDLTMRVTAEARVALPPDRGPSLAKFPALEDGFIIRMMQQPFRASGVTPRCRQEVWHMLPQGRGVRQVERIVSTISMDRVTGRQRVLNRTVRYYEAGPDDPLEAIFDEYSSQDLSFESTER